MNTLVITLIFGSLISTTLALQCYVCDETDESCSDLYGMPADHKTMCDEGVTGCSKTKSSTKLLGIETKIVVRSCATGTPYDNSICSKPQKFNLLVKSETWQCSCEGDLCNSGSQLALGLPLLIACVVKLLL